MIGAYQSVCVTLRVIYVRIALTCDTEEISDYLRLYPPWYNLVTDVTVVTQYVISAIRFLAIRFFAVWSVVADTVEYIPLCSMTTFLLLNS